MRVTIEFNSRKDPMDAQFKHYLSYLGATTNDPDELAFWIQACCFEAIMRDPQARTCSYCFTDYPPVVSVDSESDKYTARCAPSLCEVCGHEMSAEFDAGWHDERSGGELPPLHGYTDPGFWITTPRFLGDFLFTYYTREEATAMVRSAFDAGHSRAAVLAMWGKFHEDLRALRAGPDRRHRVRARVDRAMVEFATSPPDVAAPVAGRSVRSTKSKKPTKPRPRTKDV